MTLHTSHFPKKHENVKSQLADPLFTRFAARVFALGSPTAPMVSYGYSGKGGAMAAQDETVKKAIEWVSERLKEDPGASRAKLVDEAGKLFDLSPLQAEFLFRQITGA